MDSLGYDLISKILSGTPVREAIFESLEENRSFDVYENIRTEPDFFGFIGKLAAFSPELKMLTATPQMTSYSFQVYSPDLIGPVYDADDPHPYEIIVRIDPRTDTRQFEVDLKRSFDDGMDIRSSIRYLLAGGESTFKPIDIKPLWEE